jgi:ferredoxin
LYFPGEGAKGLVKNGIAIQITADEAETRIDRAATLGLVGQGLWVEVEQYLWGIQNEHMEKFLEFCFCCPCCCTAMQITKHSTRDIRSRFKSVGWVAKSNDNCINCGKCVDICPQHAITPGQFGIVIDDQCFGCGLCKNSCNTGAIEIIPKNELIKENIKDYFSGLNLEL